VAGRGRSRAGIGKPYLAGHHVDCAATGSYYRALVVSPAELGLEEQGKAMRELVDEVYLPFTTEQLRGHFLQGADEHIGYYVGSARRYHSFLKDRRTRSGIPFSEAAGPCQIEKDERFWTAATLLTLFHHADSRGCLVTLLAGAFGPAPPVAGLGTWEACLAGSSLHLSLETVLPSPPAYTEWLRAHMEERQLIPYVRYACGGSVAKALEGPTHLDALLINPANGFAVAIEAKVLSDVSCQVSYDIRRNQIARNLDVLLESNEGMPEPLSCRRPDRTLLMLLTPETFRRHPESRLYGWLLREYRDTPAALARDLPHRLRDDWAAVAKRLGWMTWEDCHSALPTCCGWLRTAASA